MCSFNRYSANHAWEKHLRTAKGCRNSVTSIISRILCSKKVHSSIKKYGCGKTISREEQEKERVTWSSVFILTLRSETVTWYLTARVHHESSQRRWVAWKTQVARSIFTVSYPPPRHHPTIFPNYIKSIQTSLLKTFIFFAMGGRCWKSGSINGLTGFQNQSIPLLTINKLHIRSYRVWWGKRVIRLPQHNIRERHATKESTHVIG